MKAITTTMAVCILSLHATADAQQTETPEAKDSQGIPATPHQEQAAREIDSDLFKQLDENRDGSVSKQEAHADSSLSARWDELDENSDGMLDAEEFSGSGDTEGVLGIGQSGRTESDMPATRHQEHAVQGDLMTELDEDGDGAISQQEAAAKAQLSDHWDQLDRNRDGKLDSSELQRLDQ